MLGILRPDIRACFESRSEDVIEIVKLGIFVVFGALLTLGGLFDDGLAAVAIVVFLFLVARPVAVFASLTGTRTDTPTKAFMSWFGPKGVATMTFALIVLGSGIEDAGQIFNLAALAVFASIIVHGLSDHAGAEWMARRAETGQCGIGMMPRRPTRRDPWRAGTSPRSTFSPTTRRCCTPTTTRGRSRSTFPPAS